MLRSNWLSYLVLAMLCGCLSFSCRATPESVQPATLELMSYNIRHGVGMDGVLDLERIAEVIRRENPDLLALQEIDHTCTRSGNRDIAGELGKALGMEAHFGKFMDFQGGRYGMAVLSKLPVQEVNIHRLPDGAEPRIALEVQVTVQGMASPISFIGIHNDWTDDAIRIKQVNALLAAIEDSGRPTVLAGDFNAVPGDLSTDIFLCGGWNNLGDFKDFTFPADKPNRTIDYIMIKGFQNPSGQTRVVDESVASDHRPIRASLRFDG